jgi:hypothetical protein
VAVVVLQDNQVAVEKVELVVAEMVEKEPAHHQEMVLLELPT